MAHYAFLDENNIVTEVIVGRNEDEVVDGISDWESHYGEIRGQKCVRTSYNSRIRNKYAVIGDRYDEAADVFIGRQPYPSWTLDSNYKWQPPVQYPSSGEHSWDENTLTWIPYEPLEEPTEDNFIS